MIPWMGISDDPLAQYDWPVDYDLDTRDHLVGRSEEAPMANATANVTVRVLRDGGPLTQEEALTVQLGLISLALQIVVGKRKNYSGTDDPYRNLRTSAIPWGIEPFMGAGVRMMDKWARTRSIVEMGEQAEMGPEPQEKLLVDWADVHNYTDIIAGLVIEDLPDRNTLIAELRERAQELPDTVAGILKLAGLEPGESDPLAETYA